MKPKRHSKSRPAIRPRRLMAERLELRMMLHAEGALAGFVFVDLDQDGERDPHESGVPGVLVRLAEGDSSEVSRSTLTDDNGAYSFDELEPGTYRLSQRQSPALLDGTDSTPAVGAITGNDQFSQVELADDQTIDENNFGEGGLRPEFISIRWFLASRPPIHQILRDTIAMGEEMAGDPSLAQSIRDASTVVDDPIDMDDPNQTPVVTDDAFSVDENSTLNIVAPGVLSNDSDADGDALSANLVTGPSNGAVTLNADGSFTYIPDTEYSRPDSFTYEATDGESTSTVATVRITVNEIGNTNAPFGAITTGSFEAPELLGIRTDLEAGAPAITAEHVTAGVDYTAYSNPPTYGPHHGFVSDGGNSITPRPTGVYTTEQPDEDLIHNLEHGHVWISYNPTLLSGADLVDLEEFVTDGGTNTGVILSPRSANTSAIALVSWAHLLTLDTFDATQIRNFVETNRGHAPEGFIASGQKADSAASEALSDGLIH